MTYNSLSTTPNSLSFWQANKYMSFIFSQNFNFIDDDRKELSLKKKIDFKT
jgi:hypothetical protein